MSARPAPRHPLLSYALFPVVMGGSFVAGCVGLERGVSPALLLALLILATVVIVASLERVMPYTGAWRRSRGDEPADLLHSTLSSLAFPKLVEPLLIAAAAPAAAWLSGAIGVDLWPSHWPLAAQAALALVVGELGQYWAHRLAHERAWLWPAHVVHHSPERLYWLNAGRDHPLGVLLLFGSELIPLVALGATPEAIVLFALVTAVHGLFQHANLDVRLGPLNWVFSMAELHRWHHSRRVEEANHNYGANLIVWDVVFGTRYLPDRAPPEEVGLSEIDAFPRGYLGQLAAPFRLTALRRGD